MSGWNRSGVPWYAHPDFVGSQQHENFEMNKHLLKAFKRSKMSNYELAKITGLSKSTIGRWLRGETDLAMSNAEKIAKAIGHKFELVKCD